MSGLVRKPIAASVAVIGFFLGLIYAIIKGVLRATVGQFSWQPPAWLAGLGSRAARTARNLAALPPERQSRFAQIAIGLTAIVAICFGMDYYYAHQPKPHRIEYKLKAPGRTAIENDAPPEPLLVQFAGPVALLAQAGKVLGSPPGITLAPRIEGSWRWEADKTLVFTPKADWPVGQKVTVSFAREGIFSPQSRLASYEAEFTTAPFVAKLADAQFYQDPVDPLAKKVVATLGFSHPVDPVDFERRIALRLYAHGEKAETGLLSQTGEALKYTVSYDKFKLTAYIHSQPLSVPAKAGRVEVTIDAGVRAARGGAPVAQPLARSVSVPGLHSLAVNGLSLDVAQNEREEPDQVLIVATTHSVTEAEIAGHVSAWLLPLYHPESKPEERTEPYSWGSPASIGPAILKAATPLKLEQIAGEHEHEQVSSFKYRADPGRYLYIKVQKGLKSFAGYQLGETTDSIAQVPAFPRELRILGQGAFLAMSGEKKIPVLVRDLPAVRYQIGRLMPGQVQHFVRFNNGTLVNPEFGAVDQENLTEIFERVEPLPKGPPGKAQYQAIDLGSYLLNDGEFRRGIFYLEAQGYDPAKKENIGEPVKRLLIVTDLGLVAKTSLDGSRDVFVQNIHTGAPVEGATVEVMAKNGSLLQSQATDVNGHAGFKDFKGFTRDREAILYLVKKAGDYSFLSINDGSRPLDFSRFDVGGVANSLEAGKLSAYLFSDRGIYRPGDEIRAGAIIKAADWARKLAGVPLQLEITDPRGLPVKRERITLSGSGFEEIRHTTQESSPTGNYTIALYIYKDGLQDEQIGAMTVKVQEFLPDRLSISAHLSSEAPQGWVSPQDLKARVSLMNLFGTPAENRRVTAAMKLSPAYPAFAAYPEFRFSDPQVAKEGFDEKLEEVKTNEKGEAEFDLNLGRFARATYRLHLVAEGFEAEGGRGVAAETVQLVSNLSYLVGVKTDGDTGYVSRNAKREALLIAIDSKAQKTAVPDLHLVLLERKFVSVLTKQGNGTFRYESRQKEIRLSDKPFAITATGTKLPLDTATPGNFSYLVVDGAGLAVSRLDYSVAGQANVTRSLEKNAELQVTLSRGDFQPGEDIELQVQAPYAGAGLISIEREKVFTYVWFKATTLSSIQHIRLPKDFEGNGYVNVTLVRDPGSDEIYASPLSYGVVPFSVSLERRKNKISVATPEMVKPGETLRMKVKAERPTRMVVFAVDEGILQVARYKNADPLGYFFQKRMLDVKTAQILDLILPEYKRLMAAAAPGGDADGGLGRHLNPFKRKRDLPVAYWSGIIDAGPQERELTYKVPDYFNGSLRVMAVAVSNETIGTFQGKTVVRGDFVLSPNAPLTVTPGDEFEVSVGVANNLKGAGKDARVSVSLQASPQFEVVGPATVELPVAELREGVTSFRIKVREQLGSASLDFTASLGKKSAHLSTGISVRPATPYTTELIIGRVKDGSVEVATGRDMHPQFRKLEAGISHLPLGLAHGLAAYLDNFPYLCTEQLTSRAIPALILGARPEFGAVKSTTGKTLSELIPVLRSRQNGEGGYGLYTANHHVIEWVSVYAQHFLLEARERGEKVPADMIASGNNYLKQLAARDGDTLEQERTAAYAIYLLTRQGIVTSNFAAGLQKRLEQNHAKTWRQDITAAYLAASYQRMKQERLAENLITSIKFGTQKGNAYYYDSMARDAQLLYLTAREFPKLAKTLPPEAMDSLVKNMQDGGYNTLSSAYAILAFDAYATATGNEAGARFTVEELLRNGQTRALALPAGLLPRTTFTADAAKLRFTSRSPYTAYYAVNQTGFDRGLPAQEIRDGFEILREYVDLNGAPLKSVRVGEEIDVRLRFRSLNGRSLANVALVDLLPGGFDLVIEPRVAEQTPSAAANQQGQGDAKDADQDKDPKPAPEVAPYKAPIGTARSTWSPDYADLREDRVVLYGTVEGEARDFVYRIKATNAGRFVVPPAYGESMYERALRARSLGSVLTVDAPAKK